MRDAIDNCAEPLTKERLIQWNNDLFSIGRESSRKPVRTDWRDDLFAPTFVGCNTPYGQVEEQFEPPLAEGLDHEMKNFIAWFNTPNDSEGVIRAAVAHLWFVTIHSFSNGNGRLARVITDMMLACADATSYRYYSMSHQIVKERDSYNSVLERTQRGTLDITEWIAWFLECFEHTIARSEKILPAASAEERFW
ncbi:MAG: Fic family protein [Chloroflexota bacterium]|nr:Fic family protein [Chloroflexota bacterium]